MVDWTKGEVEQMEEVRLGWDVVLGYVVVAVAVAEAEFELELEVSGCLR